MHGLVTYYAILGNEGKMPVPSSFLAMCFQRLAEVAELWCKGVCNAIVEIIVRVPIEIYPAGPPGAANRRDLGRAKPRLKYTQYAVKSWFLSWST